MMATNLTSQVRNIAEVTTAVARGDLSKKITVDVKGEILELKDTINTMVDQLSSFASEVSRVAREVGTEGRSEEHTSELPSLMRISYAVFCLKTQNNYNARVVSKESN